MDRKTVQKRTRAAVESLFERDGRLMVINVAERVIASRLAHHLRDLFPDHDVDVEYNRHGLLPKILKLPPRGVIKRKGRVFPDIVVHKREADAKNELVIEIKKTSSRVPRDRDLAKLRAMIKELRYTHGLLLELPTGKRSQLQNVREEWVG